MTSRLQNEYQPDLVSSPGETLLEALETIGMSQAELARRMGRPVKTINEIVQGEAAITAETALQLEQVLHIPASFWLKREQQYRESLAEKQHLLDSIE
ncbi:MAG TPA: HigA family addiction module antitoxin [Ktedonobacteraceae bacterium]|nr:HigA family addiction module antitoxin [Ktedonobacteraceae bacterium]